MSRFKRKGRNMGPVDEWLDTLGYYRKNVAYDETCLFRAISEQLYACQLYHEQIRRECITYAEENHKEFSHFMSNKIEWNIYMDRLKKHMAICGKIEIQIISRTYRKGILIFDGINRFVKEAINENYEDRFLLCHMGEDHYDVVYKKEYIQDAGFCQSLVYNELYQGVFGITNIDEIVDTMLNQKTQLLQTRADIMDVKSNSVSPIPQEEHDIEKEEMFSDTEENIKSLNDYEYMLKTRIAPFPFKVAKALDPNIYRNIEYDNWTEMRKEMRLGEWYYGDSNLIRGSACILKDCGKKLQCYIQDIEENKCVVYITSLAEKRTVDLCDLQPEDNAKPWPLPYRFSKSLVFYVPKLEMPDRKVLNKKRDKKSNSNKNNVEESQGEQLDTSINVYTGIPLQMQGDSMIYEQKTDISDTNEKYYESCTWESRNSPGPNSELVGWPESMSHESSSQVVTSGIHETGMTDGSQNSNYYYTTESYTRYNVWPNGEYVTPLPHEQVSISPAEEIQTPESFNNYYNNGNYSLVPYRPQVQMLPPVYHSQPATPVILTPSPVEMTEILLPTPPALPVYSPIPVDVSSYIPTSPYLYQPASPGWYPFGINANGFIFPTVGQINQAYSTSNPN